MSYAHDDPKHVELIKQFQAFLINNGIEAWSDVDAESQPQDSAHWMTQQLGAADRVLVVASPMYRSGLSGRLRPARGLVLGGRQT